jgi:hypothetical protein
MARTFRQLGQGYGSDPVTITALVGGVQVFSGSVPTVDEVPPGEVRPQPPEQDCFQWSQDDDWVGNVVMQITNTGSGTFQLCQTQALINTTEADSWGGVFAESVPGSSGNVVLGDPFRDVTIDGIPQSRSSSTDAYGQWTWNIEAGSTFIGTLTVNSRYNTSPVS